MSNTNWAVVALIGCLAIVSILGGLAIHQHQQMEELETDLSESESTNDELREEVYNLQEMSNTKAPNVTLTDCYGEPESRQCELTVNYPLYQYELQLNDGMADPSVVDDTEYIIRGTSDGSILILESATGDSYVYSIHIDESSEYLTEGGEENCC